MGTTTVTATTISASTTSSRFPLRLYQVTGDSMAPTLHEAERLLGVSPRWLPRRLQPAVGRIVVFREPREAGKRSIKRIVSREGSGWFVLGDNPSRSSDSRVYGPVEDAAIEAVALVRYGPARRLGRLL